MLPWLALNWNRCDDGVEIKDYGPPPPSPKSEVTIIGGPPAPKHGKYFAWSSDRDVAVRHEYAPERPLVFRLVNAASEDDLAALFSEIGLPHASQQSAGFPEDLVEPSRQISAAIVLEWQADFKRQAELLSAGRNKEAVEAINAHLLMDKRHRLTAHLKMRRGAPTLTFMPHNLWSFCQMEVAVMAVSGTGINRCQSCQSFFPTGSATGRYGRASYCSDRCRMAAHRRRKAEAIE